MVETSRYSRTITKSSPMYFADRHDRYRHEKVKYRYEKIRFFVSKSGSYKFECDKDDHPSFVFVGTIELYKNSFDPANILANRLTYVHGAEGIHRTSFEASLQSDTYVLVASITGIEKRTISILITGPAKVIFS